MLSPEFWGVLCPSTLLVRKLGLKSVNELQFKRNRTKCILHIFTSELNCGKYVEIAQYNMENQKSVLPHFCPEVEIEHSSTQMMMCLYLLKNLIM